jgi:very-short-patch-repair endonuclease
MRSAPTLSEARLWEALRGARLGVGFRRQAVVEGFIVDFLAPSVRLVVEIDGGYHARRARHDARRDRVLARAGYRVVRLSAEMVISNLPLAIEVLRQGLLR